MTEITHLLLELLTPEQLRALRRKNTIRCSCGGVPPVNSEGDVTVCDSCDGGGRIQAFCRYYATTEDTAHLPRVEIDGIGEVCYEIIE